MSPRGQQGMAFGVPPFPKGIKWLVIVTLAASIMSKLVPTVAELGVLTPGLFWHGWGWQIFTYPFVIPDPRSLIWSLLGIWLLGGSLEQQCECGASSVSMLPSPRSRDSGPRCSGSFMAASANSTTSATGPRSRG